MDDISSKNEERKMLMYANLKAEMARSNVSVEEISKVIKKNQNTTRDKIKGKFPFTFDEAYSINVKCFPYCDLKYLFKKIDTTDPPERIA